MNATSHVRPRDGGPIPAAAPLAEAWRLCLRSLCAAACTLTLPGEAQAEDRPGKILSTPGPCRISDDRDLPWRPVDLRAPEIKPDQRIACDKAGKLKIELPGNGVAEAIDMVPGFEYLVPVGRNNPVLPANKVPGRSANAEGLMQMLNAGTQDASERGIINPDAPPVTAALQLDRCDAPIGTLAVAEPQNTVSTRLETYGLGSPTTVIRMLAQQSNCFRIVERSASMQDKMGERVLSRSNSAIGTGQLVAADFIVMPNVLFAESGQLGGSGLLAGLFNNPRKPRSAQTSIELVDARSGISVAAAEGSASKSDFALSDVLPGGDSTALGGYAGTPQGKIVASSFIDNWNDIVRAVKNNPSLAHSGAGSRTATAAAARDPVTAVLIKGDLMMPKIAGTKVYSQAQNDARVLGLLVSTDEVTYLGEERNGFLKVQAGPGEGWVKKILLKKK